MRTISSYKIDARKPEHLLLMMMFVMSFSFATWQVLLNNFVVERANFTGAEIGMLQSLREVPGFLAFTAIFVLIFIREQYFALISLLTFSIGIALTGFFPNATGLYLTTVIMSIGFHYFETINKSLTLQWLDKEKTPQFLGRALSVKAIASLTAYALIWLMMTQLDIDYVWVYFIVGSIGIAAVIYMLISFSRFNQPSSQHKRLIFRKRYWLFYGLTFLSGARRQIFVVFAAFMMVEKFNYSVGEISLLFALNYVFNIFFAPKIGRLISKIGERNALVIEYIGLTVIFVSYAFVTNEIVAAGLYVVDHMFFAFAIATSTYFQKIADPQDIAATASVSFTINHIAAVFIPAILGILWLSSPKWVFLIGAGFALSSLILSLNIPRQPASGNEVVYGG